MREVESHYVDKDGKEFCKKEYSNHGYGGVFRGFKDLPKEGFPYTIKYKKKIK